MHSAIIAKTDTTHYIPRGAPIKFQIFFIFKKIDRLFRFSKNLACPVGQVCFDLLAWCVAFFHALLMFVFAFLFCFAIFWEFSVSTVLVLFVFIEKLQNEWCSFFCFSELCILNPVFTPIVRNFLCVYFPASLRFGFVYELACFPYFWQSFW